VKDPLAVGLGSLACGAGFGGGTIVAALVIVRAMEPHVSAANYEESAADPVLIGTFAGLVVGAGFGWWRSRALDHNIWQRGVIAVLSAVGAVLLAFIAWPVDQLLGVYGLAAWGVAGFILGGAGSAWARKGSREDAILVTGEVRPAKDKGGGAAQ
jgi:NhaP-type Na+/H+ or K+/H+ antiporter